MFLSIIMRTSRSQVLLQVATRSPLSVCWKYVDQTVISIIQWLQGEIASMYLEYLNLEGNHACSHD